MNDPVPQADPKAAYTAHRDAIDSAIRRVLDSGWYVLGREVEAFEGEFAGFCGAAAAVGVASGTDALALALRAVGIGPGHGVATVAHTSVATVAAIEMIGAIPVLIDVDEGFGIDPQGLADALARPPEGVAIRCVMPVHLYGQAVDLDGVLTVSDRHGIPVVEDCSQAHGATWHGRRVGTFGAIGGFSLYPTKNLGGLGDGGVLTTNDHDLAGRLRDLRQYGWGDRYVSQSVGVNSRLDELQAAILRAKLPHLDVGNARRRAIAEAYDSAVDGSGIEPPTRRPGAGHVFHQYVVSHDDRDALREALREGGIRTNVHYPVPVHEQPAYRGRVPLGPAGLQRTERLAKRILSLPMFPELDDHRVARVVGLLRDWGRG